MNDVDLVEFTERGAITVGVVQAGSVLDALNVAQFGASVLTYVKQHAGLRLLLDFHNVGYLSSAVLTELLLRFEEFALLRSRERGRIGFLNEAFRAHLAQIFEATRDLRGTPEEDSGVSISIIEGLEAWIGRWL